MIAGEVVQLPRVALCVCAGCRRIVPVGSTVALDLPGGSWVVVCAACYAGEPVGSWRGSVVIWDGDRWVTAE
jgi:RNA polymerase subunit RPABC4/transcription elongation factor Spt4